MAPDLISRKTRNAFREYLVAWTLREIGEVFEGAEVEPDRMFVPPVAGQRRSFVEQHYRPLNFASPRDVRRLLDVFGSVIKKALREVEQFPDPDDEARRIADLQHQLRDDGFKYENGRVVAASPATRRALDPVVSSNRTISELTRRDIFDEIRVEKIDWCGGLTEDEFLARLYDLDALPSEDSRLTNMRNDVWQHRVMNNDWSDDWVFSDGRLDLMRGPDETFLQFLCEMVHPVVRPAGEAERIVARLNRHLSSDGWQLAAGKRISGRPIFEPRRRAAGNVRLPESPTAKDVLSDEYVRELAGKCDAKLASGDLDGAITNARTLLEAVLYEIEKRLTGERGDYKGDLPRQFKTVAKLLRMDTERTDLDDRFKEVVRGLITVAGGLAGLGNKISDRHARERKPLPHHARVVVNASNTVATFLVESFLFQQEKGLLAPSKQRVNS